MIRSTKYAVNAYNTVESVREFFVGRVLRVETRTEQRNWSNTMDYSDWRATECTWALVWLGTHNYPPVTTPGRPTVDWYCTTHEPILNGYRQPRELEYFEQFAWVDCTNLFSDLGIPNREAEVDAHFADAMKEPLMWANFIAWESYTKAAAEKAARDRAAAEEARRLKDEAAAKAAAAKAAKKDAVLAASKAAADGLLAVAPKKGTTVTVDGFTGTVFWTGVSKYRGKFQARVGVKDARGEVRWIDAAHWAK